LRRRISTITHGWCGYAVKPAQGKEVKLRLNRSDTLAMATLRDQETQIPSLRRAYRLAQSTDDMIVIAAGAF